MRETITIFATSIEDVSPVGTDSLEVTLADVDISQIVDEVGFEELLDAMKPEDIKEYLDNKPEGDIDSE